MKRHRESEEVKSIVTSVCLKMLSQAGDSPTREVFECKTCNRKFTSFQALGGHRASHKSLSGSGTGRPHEKTHRRVLASSSSSAMTMCFNLNLTPLDRRIT
ncbi:hypothetical protein JHK82_053912 [Glycine max]|nr:hypothetical protein JHK86_053763 [Glycine max]KAG4916265.1 hypothetical protein JHK87_053822 [Glycine soja]KAG4928226.1 hypothetical protein JHK85_054712 [Glycine max]KAG5083747.1 hypothetical protein JHK84_053785 [Glycine max]KAG5086515.1 hypothetical protein JHK82_053912 [Glycine max]